MKKALAFTLSALTLFAAPTAFADAFFEVSPAAWRLQVYIPDLVVAYYTPSPCVGGSITFSSNATQDDRSRFYALVLSAQATGKKVGVYYETVSGGCQITSFYTAP
jgi:hypothetical protein